MKDLKDLQTKINCQFIDESWLHQSLCHKSYHKENPNLAHNEKLEFLGDAILDAIVSDLLMKTYANDSEGSLSRKRASVVNEERLYQFGNELGLSHHLYIGEREANNRLEENPRIIASALEALIGAIYKDQGYDKTYAWVQALFEPVLSQAFSEHDFVNDYKTRFQEWVQEEYKVTPRYRLIGEQGPDHARVFEVEVFVGDTSWGSAEGPSKKSAAQNAARQALERKPS